eukprot:Nitzschia sp. Nitz4//scaffold148_size54725//19821//21602//NITZ4_006655-RA/size54725-processed-gene-0.12-mRNA-1//1//CDS//3329536739//2741//frame0
MAAVGTKLRNMQAPPRRSSMTNMDGGSSNLLSFMSDASKAKAKQSLQRRSCQKNVKTERRRSIINSLDKYLEDDDQTESTYHQSSFSSGLSSETYGTQRSRTQQQQQQQPVSRMATNLEDSSELQPSPAKPGKPPRNNSTSSAGGGQRYRRRGSVTKYSLGTESSSHEIQDDSFHPEESSQHSFDTGSFADDFPIAVAETSSSSTLDDRPIPVMKGQRSQHRPSVATSSSSVCSIDDRPLPMKKKASPRKSSISSSDHVVATNKFSKSSSGRPPAPLRSSSARSTASNGSIEDTSSIFSDEDKSHSKRNSGLAAALLSNKPKRHSTGTASLAGLGSLPSASSDDDDDDNHNLVSDAYGSHRKSKGNKLPPRRYSTQNVPTDDEDDHRSCVSDGILMPSSKRPPRQSRKSQSSQPSQKEKPPRPFSLEAGLAFVSQHSRQDDSDCDVSVASTAANEDNGGGGGGRRYRRRGSVTKYSLDANDLDNASVASDGILANVPRPPRSDRRGSTSSRSSKTKGSATTGTTTATATATPRTSLSQSLHNFINHSSHHNEHDDDDLQSVESTPANMSGGSANPPRQRYRRRGSVTKYSLET